MNLINKIIEGLLPEDVKPKVVAVYGGGFKPPTSGHFEVVKQALQENPNIDEFIILIGGKSRDGISPEESILIWDIYKQYLPYKVEVKYTSVPPIKGIYNYAKENPQEEVLFIIGAREGNEDDFKDIASRTTSLDKYPNLNLRTIVTQGGVSGTAARNASKISLEKFSSFIPSELSGEEKEQVYNLVSDKIQEAIVGNKIKCDNCGWDWDILDGGDDLFLCHKCGHDNTPFLNENATYSKDIEIFDKIDLLTKHMIRKGMNIEPLPTLELINGDSENTKNFFGKTAYYDPNKKHIVLYTEGRHPKDIVRSYSHEIIHHIQNLEDRLGDVGGTNTNEDENLDKLEQEANLRGTMTFRNWTDSLKENKIYKHTSGFNNKLGKDPFGLNQFAREIAEEVTNYQIYCDLDGVLADFERGYEELTGVDLNKSHAPDGKEFWDPVSKAGVGFWVGLKWMSDGQELWQYIKPFNPILLSAPSRDESSRIGKHMWVKRKIPGTKLILRYARQKQLLATPTSILIDDRAINIEQWEAAGGIGILHTNAFNTIKQLKKLI